MKTTPATVKSKTFPPPDPSARPDPPFHQMDDKDFEDFCCDLAAAVTPNVQTFDLFELSGSKQYGADFYLDCGPGNLIIGSCKAHEKPGKKAILDEAVGEFVKHWETYWRIQHVTKFIICLAADAREGKRKKLIDDAKKEIRKLGIECEVWDKRTIIKNCAGHPAVVRRHLRSDWAYRLCETVYGYVSEEAIPLLDGMSKQIEALSSAQYPLASAELERLTGLLRTGETHQAAAAAREIQSGPMWLAMDPGQRAQTIRIEAAALIPEDIEKAAALYEKAAAVSPPKDRYFQIIVTAHNQGRAAALEQLGEPRTLRERTLRAALLLESGEPEVALSGLGEPDGDPADLADAWRIKAVILMSLGRSAEAIAAAKKALEIQPDYRAAKRALATAHFAASVSPAAGTPGYLWPGPFPTAFLRQDAKSIEERKEAYRLFTELFDSSSNTREKAEFLVWRLAAIIDDPKRREEASALVDQSHDIECFHPGLVVWALTRRLKYDRGKARRALISLANARQSDAAGAFMAQLSDQRKHAEGLKFVERYKPLLEQIDNEAPGYWKKHFEEKKSNARRRKKSDTPGLSGTQSVEELAESLNDDSKTPLVRFDAAEEMAEQGLWDDIVNAKDFLLDEIATGEAFRLVAFAISNVKPKAEAIAFIQENAPRFYDATPPDIKKLQLDLIKRSGDAGGALEHARAMFIDPGKSEFINRAFIEIHAGDAVSAGRTIAKAVDADNPALRNPRTVLQWATMLKRDDPVTARRLLDRVKELGLKGLSGPAMTLALELTPENIKPFADAMNAEASRSRSAAVQLYTLDEMKELQRAAIDQQLKKTELYENGDIPGHLYYGARLGLAYLAPFSPGKKRWRPDPHIAHAVNGVSRELPSAKLFLDITAVLIAEALELWEPLRKVGFELTLPHDWSAALLEMEGQTAPHQPDRVAVQELILDLVQRRRLRAVNTRPIGSFEVDFSARPGPESAVVLRFAPEGDSVSANETHDLSDPAFPRLHLADAVAESLATGSELEALCDLKLVSISKNERKRIREEVEQAKVCEAVAKRLHDLRGRLSAEVLSGRVLVGPALEAKFDDDEMARNAIELTFWQTVHVTLAPDQALWVDDRYLNGHTSIGATQIFGAQSVLNSLVLSGALTSRQRDSAISRLQKADFVYLLPNVDDLAALASEGERGAANFEERLDIAKTVYARFAGAHSKILATKPGQAIVEHAAVGNHFLFASHFIRRLLDDDSIDAEKGAIQCLAVCQSLQTDWRSGVEGDEKIKIAEYLFVTWHASILAACLHPAALLSPEGQERVRRIFASIYFNITAPATESEPELKKRVLARFVELLDFPDADDDPEETAPIIRHVINILIRIAPDELRDELFDLGEAHTLFNVKRNITIQDVSIPADEFWDALDNFSEIGDTVNLATSDDQSVTIEAHQEGILVKKGAEKPLMISFSIPRAHSPLPENRIEAFKSFLDEANFAPIERTQREEIFGNIDKSEAREDYLRKVTKVTLEGRIWSLSRIRGGQQVHISEFEPPPFAEFEQKIFTNEDGLPDSRDSQKSLEPKRRLQFLLGAPWAFPAHIIRWFQELDAEEAKSFVAQQVERAWSPIRIANLQHLAACRSDCGDAIKILEDRFVTSGLSAAPIIKNFAEAAISGMLSRGDGRDNHTSVLKAAWVWADQLFLALAGNRIDLAQLSEWCAEAASVKRSGLAELLKLNSVENPLKAHNAQMIAACLWRSGLDDFSRLSDDDKQKLAASLSLTGDGKTPQTALFSGGAPAARAGSWLTQTPKDLLSLFQDQVSTLAKALASPQALIDELLAAGSPDYALYILVGVDQLSNSQATRLFANLKRDIPHAQRDELLMMSSIVNLTPEFDDRTAKSKSKRFEEIARQHIALDVTHGRDVKGLHFILEQVIESGCRKPGAWVTNVEVMYRGVARIFVDSYATELAAFLKVLIESAKLADRLQLQVLKTEIEAYIPSR